MNRYTITYVRVQTKLLQTLRVKGKENSNYIQGVSILSHRNILFIAIIFKDVQILQRRIHTELLLRSDEQWKSLTVNKVAIKKYCYDVKLTFSLNLWKLTNRTHFSKYTFFEILTIETVILANKHSYWWIWGHSTP